MTTSRIAAMLIAISVSCNIVRATTISTVAIDNPGNPADTRYIQSGHPNYPNGIGAVALPFNIGKTEVTNAQYVAFLNAVAASDPYGLYSTSMASSTVGGILRSGSPGSYSYSVKAPELSGTYTYGNKPIVFVSWGDAARFANWLHNEQPSGSEDESTTEDGAYTLNGANTDAALSVVPRNPDARWWLPSEDEWYKAAYYNPVTGSYYDYATGTNNIPNNSPPSGDTGNSANFYNNGYTTGNSSYPLTDADAYTLSGSPYETFDQSGNVAEWNDTFFGGSVRGNRDGPWDGSSNNLRASRWDLGFPSEGNEDLGFRIATTALPEPQSFSLATASVVVLLGRRFRTCVTRRERPPS